MRVLCVIIVFFVVGVYHTNAQDGTRWMGPESNGVYYETGLLDKWPENGPVIAWHFDNLGMGYTSPVFAGGKIFITGIEGTTGYLYSLSEDSKLLWKKPYGQEWNENYQGSRTSPTIVDGRVYILSGKGGLYCLDVTSGNMIWSRDLLKDFNGRNITWGMTENLVIYDDKVICVPGGIKNNVIALNRFNGSLVWSSPGKGELSAYCSPRLIRLPERTLFVTMTANNIIGIDADTGKLLWSFGQTNTYSVHANIPLYSEGELFCFSGYGRGGPKLKLSADGSSVTKSWFNESMDNRIGGAVYVNGFIYGSGDQNREWQCIDWKTGQQKYTSTEVGIGAVVFADGNLYCYSERGEIALMKPLSDRFEIKGKTKVAMGSGPYWAHPVIHEGILYVRHGEVLIAYKIK